MQNQTFIVIYQSQKFYVDPSLLYNSSKKFRELVDKADNLQTIHLKINYNKFSSRNVGNFLKLCQNESTDVQNSEMKEICLIAKMFQADKIYNTGINFIQSNIDPNFFIPNDMFDDTSPNKYLELESDELSPIHHADLNELEFDDDFDSVTEKETETNGKKENDESNPPSNQKKQHHTVCYQITSDNHFMKCKRYYLMKDNQVICMAKQKDDEIYIGEGNDVHISENKSNNTAIIIRTRNRFNVVETNDQEFKIKYVKNGINDSIEVSFDHNGTRLEWRYKQPKRFASYKGGYGNAPIVSKKNLILQNPFNKPTFIVRKMSKKVYEAECNPNVKPMVVFAIALSQILGPL